MNLKHLLVFFIGLSLTGGMSAAQHISLTPYRWEEADMALAFPTGWDAPIPSEQDGSLLLLIAQTLADAPEVRPLGIPIINLWLISDVEPSSDLSPLLMQVLAELDITASETIPNKLLDYDAMTASGTSEDDLLFGLARAAILPDGRILLISGRAAQAQQAMFVPLFDAVANSLAIGADAAPTAPTYGVLWNTTRTLADGEGAFVNLSALAYHEDKLYLADPVAGVVVLDAKTGAVLASYPNPNLILPVDMAVNNEGVIYVADTVCQCIHILDPNGDWGASIAGFGLESPASIIVEPGPADKATISALYATDQAESGIQLWGLAAGDEAHLPFDAEVIAQPLLAVNREGRILALTLDGQVLILGEPAFQPLVKLSIDSIFVNDFMLDGSSNFLLATDNQGVLIVNSSGDIVGSIGRVVANSPLPGEFVRPHSLAIAAAGTIFVADSDGTFGAVTAMSTAVTAGRVGAIALIPGVAVQGTLDENTSQQDWTFNGAAGQAITISAVDVTGTEAVDVALRLIAPDGTAEAVNDDHGGVELITRTDAQIPGHVLAANGVYTIRVELIGGSGIYQLGIVQEQLFQLQPGGVTELRGSIEGALPKQRWNFQGQAGQVFTITMQAESGTLDPLLRLLDAAGQVVAENDDAADTALGKNAQLVQAQLPDTGTYTLEAARFDGQGDYYLIIVTTS